ncbi:MAG TPA: hypothetical protein VFX96_16300, partial [Pyrinomonadaceae bacterium]|nr:hypothetical protein [Pyrinomonadaceae bacterium]
MKKLFLIPAILLCACPEAFARNNSTSRTAATTQTQQSPQPRTQQQQQAAAARSQAFELEEYGVGIEADPRLVVMMAALDAAGWDPTPEGSEPSVFRQTLRRDLASLDANLRQRMQEFYRSRRLPAPATAAEQSARYVSLAYTLGPAPTFDAPPRTDDLPSGVLDVLDFVTLLREFYSKAQMAERLPAYVRMHNAEGERLRQPTARMLRDVLTYMRVEPVTTVVESATAEDPAKKDAKKSDSSKGRVRMLSEKPRRFRIVPDLLAAPGAINFRVIRDDYFAIVPQGIDPAASELRRAYLQYLVDPLVIRYGRQVSARRDVLKQLLADASAKTKRTLTPDVFLAVSRSLVAAADARMDEAARLRALQLRTSERLRTAADDAARGAITREAESERGRVEDASVAQLAEAYERGGVLSFYFAEQLKGLETSGFDLSNFFPDLLASFDPAREARRPDDYAAAVKRTSEARERARDERAREGGATEDARGALVKRLADVDDLLRLKDYAEAEARLRVLVREYPREPRVYFALGQAASLSAQDAYDEELQGRRLTLALDFYRQTITAAATDADAAIVSRAHVASGRILAFLERKEEAAKEFDAAIALGD